MLKQLSIILLVLSFIISPICYAQEAPRSAEEMGLSSEVWLLPDSPFYFVKQIYEKIGDFFTVGAGRQAIRDLDIARKRLWESEALLAKGDTEKVQENLERYLERIRSSKEALEKVQNNEKIQKYLPKAEALLKENEGLLAKIKSKAPETISGIWQAISDFLEKYQDEIDLIKSTVWDKLEDVAENIMNQEDIQQQVEQQLQEQIK